jgi:hypothetical protein
VKKRGPFFAVKTGGTIVTKRTNTYRSSVKKLLTLTLIVVMALGLAAPALAYTGNVQPDEGESKYDIDVYLVEHSGLDLLAGAIGEPPTDRGYAKNESIAAIGKLVIPKGENPFLDSYTQLRFKAKGVTMYVAENNFATIPSLTVAANATLTTSLTGTMLTPGAWGTWSYSLAGETMSHVVAGGLAGTLNSFGVDSTTERTIRWLVFGKVNDEDASISFQLRRNAIWVTPLTTSAPLVKTDTTAIDGTGWTPTLGLTLNEDFVVFAETNSAGTPAGANRYLVYENGRDLTYNPTTNDTTPTSGNTAVPGDLRFIIETNNAKGRTSALYMFPNGAAGSGYRIHVEPSTQQLVFIKYSDGGSALLTSYDQIKYGSAGYASLRAFYDEEFEGKLGFSAYNEGNLLRGSDWEDIASAATDISETVEIEPWTAYVKVPENIVVNPPKTGEAASVAGFITLLLAAAAIVVVKKVRA